MRRSVLFEEVRPGDRLPALDFPITVKTLVLAVCGTRDLMPYHHDPAYARSLGNRDMFVNTMFEQALFGRFITDWCGPESDFRETSLEMQGQLCPGDCVRVEGVVSEKVRMGEDRCVGLELTASGALGVAARATARIAMPSREAGPVAPCAELEKPRVAVNPEIPDFARPWLGDASPPAAAGYPVSEVQILYWCDMVEDANPLYVDGAYARQSRHGGVIAPPVGLLTWASARAGQQGVDPSAPDANCPERRPWPPRETGGEGAARVPPGTTDTIAQGSRQAYGRPLHPGDLVSRSSEVVDCSPRKRTRLGPGYFMTQLDTFTNQRGEVVGTNLFSLLRYGGSGSGSPA